MAGLCCFGSDESVKNALTTKWVSYAGGSIDPDAVYALAADVQMNAYFGGVLGSGWLENSYLVETIGIGLLQNPSGGIGSGFIAKTDADGVLSWVSTLSDYELGSTIYGITSTNDAVYVAGAIIKYDAIASSFWYDAIVSSLSSSNGTHNWSYELSSISGVDYATTSAFKSVVVDASGSIYAVGYTTITNLPSSSAYAGGKDAIVAKFEANGILAWVRYLGGVNDDEANAVSVGEDGLYVSGTTRSPHWFTLGTNTLPSVSNSYGFLAKLSSLDGAVTYTTVLGGNANDEILSMQVFSNNVYLAGTTYSANFCTANKLNNLGGSKDGFVLQLTDYGATYQTNWFRYIGTNSVDAVYSIALMDSNRVVVCGSTDSGRWMQGQDEVSKAYSGGTDGFIYQLNRDTGAPVWSSYVGGTNTEVAYALAICGTTLFLGGTTGSDDWAMFGGFQDQWGLLPPNDPHLNTETGFVGMWSQEPGVPPAITNDIADILEVHEGERVEFFLGVNSSLSVKYYWFKNGESVGGVSTNRYVIASALPTDSGTFYQCIASNVLGCTTSSVAHLTVIANGILDVSITPPSAVSQGAVWQLTGGVWRASGAIALYPGTYTVAFTNLAGAGWTTPATCQVDVVSSKTTTVVAVYLAPVATAVRTISSWTNVSLAVTCPPEVTAWTLVEQIPMNATPTLYSSGTWNPTARTLTYTGAASSSVSYTVLLSEAGDYAISGSITSMPINVTMPVTGGQLVSRGDFLRQISGTNVWVYMSQPAASKLWILTEDMSETTLTPGNISMPTYANWDSEGKTLSWMRTSSGSGVVLSYTVSGTEGSTNFLSGACYIMGELKTRMIYGDNTVIIPVPIITNDLADVTVHEGERVEFVFGVNSTPDTKYYWLKNGVPVGGVSTNRYVIVSALPTDNGTTYQCIVSNVLGDATSRVAHLTIIANGVLDVSITPPSAVARGAAWQLTGGVWRTSGSIAVYPGTYSVAFTNLTGWTTPATREIVVVSSQTTTVAAVYLAPVATAVRTISSWTNVSLAVTCPSEVSSWTLVEHIPANAVPALYSPGAWNATARTLTYTGTASSSASYTILLGDVGDSYLTNSIITSMPIDVTVPATGDYVVSRGDFLRRISGTNVWIYMSQPTTAKLWVLTEDMSKTTLTPGNISMPTDASWDSEGKTLSWMRTSSGAGVVLSYTVSGTEGSTNVLVGSCFISPNINKSVYGDCTIIIPKIPAVVPPPTILNFVWNGTSSSLTFTSILEQAYMVLTNANLSVTNGWRNCVPATGQGAITTVTVPVVEPQLFYRVKSE
jgi:hypothetical protein